MKVKQFLGCAKDIRVDCSVLEGQLKADTLTNNEVYAYLNAFLGT